MRSGASQACAACKYQRRKCDSNCALAPYFPADKPRMFQNAHRLYGVSNILKIIAPLDEEQRDDAMKSIIYESDMRRRFPVHGCLTVIWNLKRQIQRHKDELETIKPWLLYFRSREQQSCGAAAAGQFDYCDDDPDASSVQFDPPEQFGYGYGLELPLYEQQEIDRYSVWYANRDYAETSSRNRYRDYVAETTELMQQLWAQQQQYSGELDEPTHDDSPEVKPSIIPPGMPLQQDLIIE